MTKFFREAMMGKTRLASADASENAIHIKALVGDAQDCCGNAEKIPGAMFQHGQAIETS